MNFIDLGMELRIGICTYLDQSPLWYWISCHLMNIHVQINKVNSIVSTCTPIPIFHFIAFNLRSFLIWSHYEAIRFTNHGVLVSWCLCLGLGRRSETAILHPSSSLSLSLSLPPSLSLSRSLSLSLSLSLFTPLPPCCVLSPLKTDHLQRLQIDRKPCVQRTM